MHAAVSFCLIVEYPHDHEMIVVERFLYEFRRGRKTKPVANASEKRHKKMWKKYQQRMWRNEEWKIDEDERRWNSFDSE